MAVSRLWAVKNNTGSAVTYIENPEKTTDLSETVDSDIEGTFGFVLESVKTENGRLIAGLNCDPFNAEEEFLDVKKKFDNTDGVQAYHGYISFSQKDNLLPTDALAIGKKIMEEMWGDRYQVILAVHTNTDNLHMHFLVNSVSFVDGKKARGMDTNYRKLRAVLDKTCNEYGLMVVSPTHNRQKTLDSQVVEAVLEASLEARNKKEIPELLEAKGYKIVRKNYIRTPDGRVVNVKKLDGNLSVEPSDKKDASKISGKSQKEGYKNVEHKLDSPGKDTEGRGIL